MSVKDLLNFISSDPQLSSGNCVQKVNLLKLNGPQGLELNRKSRGRGMPMNVAPVTQSRVALVLDAENCLDRLYGGCYPGLKLPYGT